MAAPDAEWDLEEEVERREVFQRISAYYDRAEADLRARRARATTDDERRRALRDLRTYLGWEPYGGEP